MTNEELVERIQQGRDVEGNMGQLYRQNEKLLRKFCKPFEGYEPMEDLLQEAYFGLWTAACQYEHGHGTKFMSYAGYWVRAEIREYVWGEGALIAIPRHVHGRATAYGAAVAALEQRLGREATRWEISSATGYSMEEVEAFERAQGTRHMASLDLPLDSEDYGAATLGDTIAGADDIEATVTEAEYADERRDFLWGLIGRICTEQERQTMELVFGRGMSMAAAAREMGASRQAVAAWKSRALGKLKRRATLITEQLEEADADLYRGGLTSFREHGSQVERIVEKRLDIIEGALVE